MITIRMFITVRAECTQMGWSQNVFGFRFQFELFNNDKFETCLPFRQYRTVSDVTNITGIGKLT